ncbi:MAG TPA: hypothetical protein VIS07_13590 [Candidatus Binatia bacterium]
MSRAEEPRDLLAERIRRLERRIEELAADLTSTATQISRTSANVDSLVDLVGRLGRVVDVQGTVLSGEESELERKVDAVQESVRELASGLAEVVERLERIGGALTTALDPRRSEPGESGPSR